VSFGGVFLKIYIFNFECLEIFINFFFQKSKNGQAFYVQNQNSKNEMKTKSQGVSDLDVNALNYK